MVPFLVTRKRLDLFFIISFLVVLIMPFFGYTILFTARALFEGSFQNFYHDYSFKMHMSGYFPVLTAAVFGSFFGVIINWFKTMNQKAELDKQKLAIELELIKSKLNPHFLFNTLNNIDSLIHHNPDEASSALIRLSEMMRYLTYETVSDVVDLKREIDYIRNFIELNRIRIKSPDDIRFEVTGDQNVMIPPAICVPLVENAFKFASFRIERPCVDIKIASNKGIVVFDIANYRENNEAKPKKDSGLGLINLRKRLDLTYPDNYQLIIEPTETLFRAKLILNTNAN
jgi:LytS/YehU family sensor histidine kinase